MKHVFFALSLLLFIGCNSKDNKPEDTLSKMTILPKTMTLDGFNGEVRASTIKGGEAPYTIVYPKYSHTGGNYGYLVPFNMADIQIKIEDDKIILEVKNEDFRILHTPFLLRDSEGRKAMFVAEPTVFVLEYDCLAPFIKYYDDPEFWQNY